jgi:tetratricopeptide (TPR) repeat protein
MIPRAYFDYLQHRPNLTLESVFTHNVHDVVSLAALTIHACDRVIIEPAALDDPLDLYSLARVFEIAADRERSIGLYEMALSNDLPEPIRQKALENLSIAYRSVGDHERSREVCEKLMRYPLFSMPAYEGAAIYYERVARDYEAALGVVQEALVRVDGKRWRTLLEARLHRLQQKTIRYDP